MEQWHIVIMSVFVCDSSDSWVEFVRATSRTDADTKARTQLIARLLAEECFEDASEIDIDEFAIVICIGGTYPTYPQ